MSPCRSQHIASLIFIGLLFIVSGCLPFSCQRGEPRALLPSDSLSRQMAELVPVDTLEVVWETRGESDYLLEHPRTVRFGPDGAIYVSDVRANHILEFFPDGALNRVHTSISYNAPYIIGVRRDTIIVLNPISRRIDLTTEEGSIMHIGLPEDIPPEALQYATAGTGLIYYKVIGQDFPGYIAIIAENGEVLDQSPLPDPYWRYAGMLRMWGDTPISLSAYRPVIDVINADGSLDSLALMGFDSPMLARSRAFIKGHIREAPLLYSSAAPSGDSLFVLNLRPGWLRIDIFNREGSLTNRLVQAEPGFNKDFYPVDIDVRPAPDGSYLISIVYLNPEPRLVLYEWSLE